MLIEVSSPCGWIEKDLPDNVAQARIAGGTARPLSEERQKISREFAMMDRAKNNVTRVMNTKPAGRFGRLVSAFSDVFGVCAD